MTERNQTFQDEVSLSQLENVRTRRVLAFIVDYLVVGVLSAIVIFLVGLLTLGLGFFFAPVIVPLIAMAYVGLTMGGPNQATPGMQFFAIKIVREDGSMVDPFLAILHGVLFWFLHFTFVLLAVSLFSSRKRLIQDMLLGTFVIRSDR